MKILHTLFLIFFVLYSSYAQSPAPDVIFYNGNLITMDEDQPQSEALAIEGEHILAVGSNNSILLLADSLTQIIDLNGLTVLPGFIDSHTHRLLTDWLWEYSGPDQPIEDAIQVGWTGIHELYMKQHDVDSLLAWDALGKLRLRVNGYLSMDEPDNHFDRFYKAYSPRQMNSPYFSISGLKITLDQEWGQTIRYSADTLNAGIREAHDLGWQIAVHAFPDTTITMVLDAFESAQNGVGGDVYRHRIEHAAIVNDFNMNRMANLGVIASMQSSTGFPDDSTFQVYIPVEDYNWLARTRDFINAGVVVACNTDAPWGTVDWRNWSGQKHKGSVIELIYQLATRRDINNREPEPFQLAQTITVEQAIRSMTIMGAYATFEEDIKGSLTPGKYADLVIFSADPLTTPIGELREIRNLLTMIGGKVEYCAPGFEALCGQLNTNIALNRPVTASNYSPDFPAENALDGDYNTRWDAGDGPVQWIEIDLGVPSDIDQVAMVMSIAGEGVINHRLSGKSSTDTDYQVLHEYRFYSRDGDVFSYTPPQPWQDIEFLRIETFDYPSWVSWREIRVSGVNSFDTTLTIDGRYWDADYQVLAQKQNTNNGFGDNIDLNRLYYYFDEVGQDLYLGLEGKLNTMSENNDGIGLWLNFSSLDGAPAGTSLGNGVGSHYMNGNNGANPDFKADFEVDYMFSVDPDSVADHTNVNVVQLIGERTAQFLGSCTQDGSPAWNINSGIFAEQTVRFAFNNSGNAYRGFEICIPYEQLGITSAENMDVFAFIVSGTAFFSNVTVPGNITTFNMGFDTDFNLLEGGPFHASVELTSVDDLKSASPVADFALYQNYPNPFNPETKIRFALPAPAETKLIIYDLLGREVQVLVSGMVSTGIHEVLFNAAELPSGLYFYQLESSGFRQTKKLVLLK